MVNSELSEISYVIQAGVTTYPIGFEYHFNENNSPQLLVKIGESVAIINVDFQLSTDESEIILIPTEEEARAQSGPNDTRWMERIVGQELLITRDIPFVQTSDYSVGRINPEQIEYDFDRAVMRDQEILNQLSDFTVDVALAESLANAAVETANEAATAANQATATANTALDTADTAIATANEAVTLAQGAYSKTEVDNKITVINAGIDANADAIQRTREDFIEADSDIHTILNNHASELTTLHNDVDDLGDQVSGIEEKIPETASATNPLVTKQQLLDEEMDIREDMNETDGQLQTQITAQAAAIAGKQDKLSAGYGITIDESTNTISTEFPTHVSSINGYDGHILLEPGDGIEFENTTGTLGSGWKISATASGGASLPDQTDNAGKFLTTDGTTASWSRNIYTSGTTIAFGTEVYPLGAASVSVGSSSCASGNGAISVGLLSRATKEAAIAIGASAKATADNAIQLGGKPWVDGYTNSDANTFKVGNANGNFEMMSADGTIPAARMSATAGTTGQVLTKTDTGMAWQDAAGGGDYLPLSGGTMTGAINYNVGELQSYIWSDAPLFTATFTAVGGSPTYDEAGLYATANGLCIGYKGAAAPLLSFLLGANRIEPPDNRVALGTYSNLFKSVGTKKLVSGVDTSDYSIIEIIVPQKKGTMALLEDIDAAVGDISTALTAILGE